MEYEPFKLRLLVPSFDDMDPSEVIGCNHLNRDSSLDPVICLPWSNVDLYDLLGSEDHKWAGSRFRL